VPSTVSIQNIAGIQLDVHSLASLAGYLGAALGVLMVLPQMRRTLRNPALPGVSAMSWALTAMSCLTWLLYGIRADEVPQIPGNVFMVSGAIVIVLAVPGATSRAIRGLVLGGLVLLLALLAVVLPPVAIGFIAFGIGLFSAVPQLLRSLARTETASSGVSVMAWALRAASQVAWLFYAVVRGDVTVTISAIFILTSSLVLVASELWPRRATAIAAPEVAYAGR
jgi:uncharacterized protein with PQ loop repeat